MQTWREQYRPIIARIISAHGGVDSPELQQALREAFPHPPRILHPYKIWRDEIRRQLSERNDPPRDVTSQPKFVPLPGQRTLFDAEEEHLERMREAGL